MAGAFDGLCHAALKFKRVARQTTWKDFALVVDKFQQKHKVNFEFASETISKKLLGSNYSEIEEFGLSILRRHILLLPEENIKEIVSDELKNWNSRTMKIESNNLTE